MAPTANQTPNKTGFEQTPLSKLILQEAESKTEATLADWPLLEERRLPARHRRHADATLPV